MIIAENMFTEKRVSGCCFNKEPKVQETWRSDMLCPTSINCGSGVYQNRICDA